MRQAKCGREPNGAAVGRGERIRLMQTSFAVENRSKHRSMRRWLGWPQSKSDPERCGQEQIEPYRDIRQTNFGWRSWLRTSTPPPQIPNEHRCVPRCINDYILAFGHSRVSVKARIHQIPHGAEQSRIVGQWANDGCQTRHTRRDATDD